MAEQDKSSNSLAGCRVFVSYSHDSPEHEERVLALANQLRNDGIEAWIDRHVQDPNEGWIRWMRSQVRQASRVLLVFTETYLRRFEGDEEQGKGLGAMFEGVIVTQWLYESGGCNAKFRPVVFTEEDERFIPPELRRFNRYRVDTQDHYQELLRWLHEAPRIVAPMVGQKPDLPPESAPGLFPSKPHEPCSPPHPDQKGPAKAWHHRGLWAGLIVAMATIMLSPFITPPLSTVSSRLWYKKASPSPVQIPRKETSPNSSSEPSAQPSQAGSFRYTPFTVGADTPGPTKVGIAILRNAATDLLERAVQPAFEAMTNQERVFIPNALNTRELSEGGDFDRLWNGDESSVASVVENDLSSLRCILTMKLFSTKPLRFVKSLDVTSISPGLSRDYRLTATKDSLTEKLSNILHNATPPLNGG